MKAKFRRVKKYYKLFVRFVIPMMMTALLCIASPVFARTVTNTFSASSQSGSSLEQQARSLYQSGQFSQAASLFQQAASDYKSQNDTIRQALSLSNLSLCYQQLGQWNEANQAITDSIALSEGTEKTPQLLALAQALDIQGGLQLARGQADLALKSWERATVIYTQQNKPTKALISQTNSAQALQSLGLYRRAITLLQTALKLDELSTAKDRQLKILTVPASPETATALRTLGDSLRVVGNLEQARFVLERSLAIANKLQLPETIALAQLSLGNTDRASSDTQTALNFYQQAAASAPANLRVQAQLNQISLLVDSDRSDQVKTLLPQVQQQIEALPKSNTAIEARVNLAQTMMRMRKAEGTRGQGDKGTRGQGDKGTRGQGDKGTRGQGERENIDTALTSWDEIAKILAVAVEQGKELGNPRTQAYALGSLGNVYEQTRQWSEAENLTQQAVQLAQQINAGDIAYLWQWQLGRVEKAQGKNESAIAAYKEAVGTIKSLRADLASASPDVQFSFRDAVEPIHRQLVGLLVESNQKDNFKAARDVIEGLQLVELDNFFREACLNADPTQIDRVDRRAAVIYPIILEDQLAIIASLPKSDQNTQNQEDNRDFRYYKTAIDRQQIEELASGLRDDLSQQTAFDLALPKLQQMYNLVLRPEATDLEASKVETLVFVLDGVLRNIPMTALHDGQKFLVEKYSVALTPGLQLLAPRKREQERLGALVAGLGAARPPEFSALPNVEKEVKKIASEIPSSVLFNQKFTNSAFTDRVSAASYPIVHLATHGQFSSQQDKTFILTWDGKIKVNQLGSLLKTVELSRDNSLELLVLSACETAQGDERSALGLAGVAVRSGARSTVATLWRVDDEASATLISQFYEQLVQASKTGISKAEALRRAQLAILKNPEYKSPYYWSAYVLLGNWT